MSLAPTVQSNMRKQTSVLMPRWFMLEMVGKDFPVNPAGIVTIKDSSFTIDANKMSPYDPCIVNFRGSKYLIWKDENDALIEVW